MTGHLKCGALLSIVAATALASGIPEKPLSPARFIDYPRPSLSPRSPSGSPAAAQAAAERGARLLPLYFEKQGDRFLARTPQMGLLFQTDAIGLSFGPSAPDVAIRFAGARTGVRPSGEQPAGSHSNYFLEGGPASVRWQHFAAVRYSALWPGIDLLYHGHNQEIEYDFQIAPQADPRLIRVRMQGSASISVDKAGDLWIACNDQKMRHLRPVAYQEIAGRRVPVASGYRLIGKKEFGFWLGDYDHARPLTIDPVLDFSTLLGGQGFEVATGIAVDRSNNIYVTGFTESGDFLRDSSATHLFPSRSSRNQDAFLVKLDGKTKSVVYANFYGGTGFDEAISVAVDSSGAATIAGLTFSPDLPLVNQFLGRPGLLEYFVYGFVAQFSPDGSQLAFSTYTGPGGAYGVAAGASSTVYVVGGTICYASPAYYEFSPTFDALQRTCSAGTNEFVQAGFIVRLTRAGKLDYATFFVPPGAAGRSTGLSDVAVDAQENVYVAGTTVGGNQVPRYDQSGFDEEGEVAKFDGAGRLLWSTQISGERDEEALRIAVDSNGNSYVTGYTTSQALRVTAGAFQPKPPSNLRVPNVERTALGDVSNRPLFDSYVAKVNGQGQVIYTSYLGGVGDDYGWGIAADGNGRAYVTGYTNSRDFPITAGALQTTYGGGPTDAFIVVVAPDGKSLEQASFLGGTGREEGYQVALDADGNVYYAGATDSANTAVTSESVQSVLRGVDAAVAKLNLQTCDATLAGVTRTLASAAGSTNLTVNTSSSSCPWTLSSLVPWIQVTPAKGSGPGKASVSVSENTTPDARLGIFSINGRRTFVYQDGRTPCRILTAPGEVALSSSSERKQVAILSIDPACKWTAQSDQDWLKVLSSPSGSGSGSVVIGTDPNNSANSRTATLTIGNRKIPVSQNGGNCSITTSSESGAFGPAGGLGALRILASSDQCPWKAQSQASWLSILTGDSGYGTGRVRFGVARNDTGQIRNGSIVVGDLRFTVTQEQVYTDLRDQAPAYGGAAGTQTTQARDRLRPAFSALRPHSSNEPAGGDLANCGSKQPSTPIQLDANGTKISVSITRDRAGCGLVDVSRATDWLTVNVVDGSSINPKLELSAKPNTNTQSRNAEIVENSGDANQNLWHLQIVQAGTTRAPLALDPSKRQLQADSGQAVINVNTADGSPCDWSIDTLPVWIQAGNSTGACGSALTLNYDRNTTSSARQGAIRFNTGDEVQMEQQAAPEKPKCSFTFQERDPIDVTADGGQATFNVSTADGCTWSAASNKEDWVTFPQGRTGTGSQTLVVNVVPNDTASARLASITVDQATAYVREAAASVLPKACTYNLSPQSANYPLDGGSGTIQVTTTTDCQWQASIPSGDPWVKISGGGSGSGAGTVSYTVDPNSPGGASRSTTIAVQGVAFQVTQDAGTIVPPKPSSGTISASPNPITACNSQALGKTTITWSTVAEGRIEVRIGTIDGSLFASGTEGSQETGEWFSAPSTIYLVQNGTVILAQTTVTTACGNQPKPTGQIQASTNTLPLCSPQTSGTVTITWSTNNVSAVTIRSNSFDGAALASGGASGSANVAVTPPATLLLLDASGGVAPSADRVLDSVKVAPGPCGNQTGTPPPATDLAENAADWSAEFLFGGKNASGGGVTVNDPNFVVAGSYSLYLFSDTADQIRVTRKIPGTGWDLSKNTSLEFTILSSVPAGYWKAGSPYVRLNSANGSLTIAPNVDVASPSAQNWVKLTLPITGNASWQSATTGQFDLKSVTSIQISFDVAGYGWDMILDGIFIR